MERKTETRILIPTEMNIRRCASTLENGGLVAFPTETVYALGADATNAEAVKKVYEAKGRPTDKPFIVAVADRSDIKKVARDIPEKAEVLMKKFMPGALTLLLNRADCIPDIVTAGSNTVAVRIPDNNIARKLLELVARPVTVPSANTSDKPSPTLAKHVKDDLDGKVEYILDGGASEIGIESTIIDVRINPPVVLRVGGVSVEDIEAAIGKVEIKREQPKYSTNYIPNAEVMFSAYYDEMYENICRRYDELTARGRKTAIICLESNRTRYGERTVLSAGADYNDYAHNIFALLRGADDEHYDAIIAEGVRPVGIGLPLINRLIKISGGIII